MRSGRVLPIIFVAIGVTLIFFGVRALLRAKASSDWPTAQGKVIESSTERRRSSGTKHNKPTYYARIVYEFSLDGRTIRGSRVGYGDYGSGNSSHAQRIADRYPRDRTVTVYYMPGNPQECLLEPGASAGAWLVPLGGLIFVAVGGLVVMSSRRRGKRTAQPDGVRHGPCKVLKDFGVLDEVGTGASLMKTEARMSLRDGMRVLEVTMTYATGVDERWQTFIWRIDGNQLKAVADDLERVSRMVECAQGKKVHGRLIERVMARFQGVRFLADLGPVAFLDGQEIVNGLVGEAFGNKYFLYEVVQNGSAYIQPFPVSSLRAIVKVLRNAC